MNKFEITLKEYFDHKIESLNELFETKVAASEKATKIAADALHDKLFEMNKFREELKEKNNTFLTITEHKIFLDSVEKDVRMLRESKATLEGKASQMSVNIALAISIIGILIGIIGMLHDFKSSPAPLSPVPHTLQVK